MTPLAHQQAVEQRGPGFLPCSSRVFPDAGHDSFSVFMCPTSGYRFAGRVEQMATIEIDVTLLRATSDTNYFMPRVPRGIALFTQPLPTRAISPLPNLSSKRKQATRMARSFLTPPPKGFLSYFRLTFGGAPVLVGLSAVSLQVTSGTMKKSRGWPH